jgi:hypothetical protein
VRGVAEQVLTPPRVVEPDDRRARQRRPTEREEVVGRVVEQDGDVQRGVGSGPLGRVREEQVRPSPALGHELAVRPDAVLEADRGPVAPLRIVGVAAQERGGVDRGHRRLSRCRNGTEPETGTRWLSSC